MELIAFAVGTVLGVVLMLKSVERLMWIVVNAFVALSIQLQTPMRQENNTFGNNEELIVNGFTSKS